MSSKKMTNDSNALLRAIAAELSIVSVFANSVESSLIDVFADGSPQDRAVEEMQDVDLLIQHIAELRAFMMRVLESGGAHELSGVANAVSGIRLEALKWRFADALGLPAEQPACADSGRFEFL